MPDNEWRYYGDPEAIARFRSHAEPRVAEYLGLVDELAQYARRSLTARDRALLPMDDYLDAIDRAEAALKAVRDASRQRRSQSEMETPRGSDPRGGDVGHTHEETRR